MWLKFWKNREKKSPKTKRINQRQKRIEHYKSILDDLFWGAFEVRPLDSIYTIIRVSGIEEANWDFFEESRKAFKDFNWILKKVVAKSSVDSKRRIGLLMYCQAIEMSAPQEILLNLLNCIQNEPFRINPFLHLFKKVTKGDRRFLDTIPPSATKKFREIKQKANKCNKKDLISSIDTFFNERVRNAFSHSEYILTDHSFRYSSRGHTEEASIQDIDKLITECFAFYSAFFLAHKEWRLQIGELKKYHKCPNYEVLELLSSEKDGLYGFSIHFSNGSKATYKREQSGTEAVNLVINKDGSINFNCGMITELEKTWKVNGEPFIEKL